MVYLINAHYGKIKRVTYRAVDPSVKPIFRHHWSPYRYLSCDKYLTENIESLRKDPDLIITSWHRLPFMQAKASVQSSGLSGPIWLTTQAMRERYRRTNSYPLYPVNDSSFRWCLRFDLGLYPEFWGK